MKLAALKALSYSEFVSYFEQFNNEDSMSLIICAKIRPKLDEQIKDFWDKLYDDKIQNKIFHIERKCSSLPNPPYLSNEDSYEKLKSQIDEVKIVFFHSELSNFVNYADDEYHFIDLSNIYIHMFQKRILG